MTGMTHLACYLKELYKMLVYEMFLEMHHSKNASESGVYLV